MHLLRGDAEQAITAQERGLELCRARDLRLLFSVTVTTLGAAYAQSRRVAEAVSLLEQALRATGTLSPQEQAALTQEIDAEIEEAFAFAKASPFPAGADWNACNYSTQTPLADRLLHDLESGRFDHYQREAVPGPY